MADGRIELEIQVSDGQVRGELKDLEKTSGKEGAKSGRAFGKRFSSNAGSSIDVSQIKSALGTVAKVAAGAAAAITAGLGTAVYLSTQQEESINNLEASLRRIGEFSKETSKDLQGFASSLQSQTVIGDEVILQQLAIAQSYGATAEQSKALVAAAIDLSAAQGKDLNSSVQQLSKTLGGYAGELGETQPALKALTQEQLRNGGAIEIIAKQYAGFAAQQTRTFSGALSQTKNIFGDLLEAIGSLVTSSPVVIGLIKNAGEVFQGLIQRVNENASSLKGLVANGINIAIKSFDILKNVVNLVFTALSNSGVIDAAISLFDRLKLQVDIIVDSFGNVFGAVEQANSGISTFGTAANIILRGLTAAIEVVRAGFSSLATIGGAVGNAVGIISDESFQKLKDSAVESAASARDALKNIISDDVIVSTEEAALTMRETLGLTTAGLVDEETGESAIDKALGVLASPEKAEMIAANAQAIGEGVSSGLKAVSDATDSVEKDIDQTAKTINSAINNGLVNGVSAGFQQLGKALAGAGGGFQSFLGLVLGVMGDIAISIGNTVIASAFAIEALQKAPFGSAAAAIVAGGALVAVGAALKAFAGGFGGGGAAGSSSGSEGTFTAPPGGGNLNEQVRFNEEEERRQAQAVSLTVQGDILDSEDTGRRLLTILNENFESESSSLIDARFA